jgi:hypothetical protein
LNCRVFITNAHLQSEFSESSFWNDFESACFGSKIGSEILKESEICIFVWKSKASHLEKSDICACVYQTRTFNYSLKIIEVITHLPIY